MAHVKHLGGWFHYFKCNFFLKSGVFLNVAKAKAVEAVKCCFAALCCTFYTA